MKYALVGYGRMGRAIEGVAQARGHQLVCIVDPSEKGKRVRRRIQAGDLDGAEVAFEFSAPASAEANVIALLAAGVAVVCGTTGWTGSPALKRAVSKSRAGAVVAANFSVGMNVFYEIVREAARRFGGTDSYDPWILESHHRGKADAPSGTARWLGALVVEQDPRRWSLQEGNPPGAMPPGAVHLASIRAGDEPGVHTVGFDGPHDVVTLTHRSRGRDGFAWGAVLAGEWLRGRRGLHGFHRVLADLSSERRPRR